MNPTEAPTLPLDRLRKLDPRARAAAVLELVEAGSCQGSEADVALLALELAAPSAGPSSILTTADRVRVVAGSWLRRTVGRKRTVSPEETRDLALRALVLLRGALTAEMQRLVFVSGEDRWPELGVHLAELAVGADALPRPAARTLGRCLAAFAEAHPGPALAGAAATLLKSDDRETLLAVDRAFHAFAGVVAEGGLDVASLGDVLTDLADAAWAYPDHRRRGPVDACIALADDGISRRLSPAAEVASAYARVRRVLVDRAHPAHGAALSALRRSTEPSLGPRAWRWMASEDLAAAAMERVANPQSERDAAAMLSAWHLLARPARARRLSMIEQPPGAALAASGGAEALRGWASGARVGLAHAVRVWVSGRAAVPRADAARAALEPLMADRDEGVRLMSLRACDARDLPDYAFDASGVVSRGAVLRWSAIGADGGPRAAGSGRARPADVARARTLTRLVRSPHAATRAVAVQEWERVWPWRPSSAASRAAAAAWRAGDAAGFDAAVRARLDGARAGAVAEAMDAVMLVRALRLAPVFEADLVALCGLGGEGASRLVATAVAALGGVGGVGGVMGDGAAAAIRRAADHDDARVRANAVEALRPGALDDEPGDAGVAGVGGAAWLVEVKPTEHHRVRANALRVVLGRGGGRRYEPAAVEGVHAMLTDDRAMHRLAGLWLAERALCGLGRERLGPRWDSLSRRVATMSDDAEPRVRARAKRCASRLLVELRRTWPGAGRPAAVEVGPARRTGGLGAGVEVGV